MMSQYWDELFNYVFNDFVKGRDGLELISQNPIIFLQESDDFSAICDWRSQECENERFDSLLLMRLFVISWSKPLQGIAAWMKNDLIYSAPIFKFTQPLLLRLFTLFLEDNISLKRQILDDTIAGHDANTTALITAAETVLNQYLQRCEKLNRRFRGDQRRWQETDWFSSAELQKGLARGKVEFRSRRDRKFDCYFAELFMAVTVVNEFYPKSPLIRALARVPLHFPASYDYFEHYFQRYIQQLYLCNAEPWFLFELMRNIVPEAFLFLCSRTLFSICEGEALVRYFDELYPIDGLIGCSHTKAEYLQCFSKLALISPIYENMDAEHGR